MHVDVVRRQRSLGLRSQSLGRANVHGVSNIACVWAGRVLTDACGLEPKTKKACATAPRDARTPDLEVNSPTL
jgi:hypothetical protein